VKALIVYYSYTGHAKKVADFFSEALRGRGSVSVERLKPAQEIPSFIGQCKAAFARQRAELEPGITLDLSPYDLVVIGCPVWAFAPAPAVNTWLDKINGLSGKRAIVFLTSGSGAGVGKCFKNIRSVLESKGIARVAEMNIPDRKWSDDDFVRMSIGKVTTEAFI
jgi:flavodoxin